MRRVYLLIVAVILVDTMFFAAVSPLLPHYKDELDLSKTAAGLLASSYPAGTLLGSIPAGWAVLKLGVKPTLLIGLSALALSSLAFGFAESIVLLDAARFAQGLGGACMWASGFAWLIAVAPPARRGELIGSALGAAIVGVLLGPVVGGAATLLTPRVVFSGVAALAVVLAAVAWTTPGVAPDGADPRAGFRAALRRPAVAAGLWLYCLPAVFAGVIGVLVPLRLDDLGASGVAIGAIFLAAAAGEAVVSPIAGRLSDRRGRLVPIQLGLAGAMMMAVLLPIPASIAVAATFLVLAVLALGTFWAPAAALLSDASEQAGLNMGIAFALSNAGWATGHLIGGGAGAALADATADAVPYGLLALACAVTLWWAVRRTTPVSATPS